MARKRQDGRSRTNDSSWIRSVQDKGRAISKRLGRDQLPHDTSRAARAVVRLAAELREKLKIVNDNETLALSIAHDMAELREAARSYDAHVKALLGPDTDLSENSCVELEMAVYHIAYHAGRLRRTLDIFVDQVFEAGHKKHRAKRRHL